MNLNFWFITIAGEIHESRVEQSRDCSCLSNCDDVLYDAITNKMTIYISNHSIDPL